MTEAPPRSFDHSEPIKCKIRVYSKLPDTAQTQPTDSETWMYINSRIGVRREYLHCSCDQYAKNIHYAQGPSCSML